MSLCISTDYIQFAEQTVALHEWRGPMRWNSTAMFLHNHHNREVAMSIVLYTIGNGVGIVKIATCVHHLRKISFVYNRIHDRKLYYQSIKFKHQALLCLASNSPSVVQRSFQALRASDSRSLRVLRISCILKAMSVTGL